MAMSESTIEPWWFPRNLFFSFLKTMELRLCYISTFFTNISKNFQELTLQAKKKKFHCLKYQVLSRTGLKIRESAALDSAEIGRLPPDSTFEVSERIEVVLPSLGTASTSPSKSLMRLHVIFPIEGWVTEESSFVYLLPGQNIPKDFRAATEEQLQKRAKAAFNSKGQDLRKILGTDCKDFVVIKRGFDVERLKEDLKNAEAMHQFLDKKPVPGYTSTSLYENTRGWASIPLVSLGGREGEEGNRHGDATLHNNSEYLSTSALRKCPYFQRILSEIKKEGLGEIQKVRLMKLRAGGNIAPHKDFFPVDSVVRLHIPIITNEKVKFRIRNSQQYLSPGVLWFTNVRQQHEVRNLSSEDRVHLVIDLMTSEKFQNIILDKD